MDWVQRNLENLKHLKAPEKSEKEGGQEQTKIIRKPLYFSLGVSRFWAEAFAVFRVRSYVLGLKRVANCNFCFGELGL
jgi:hypothetical protein